MYRKVLAALVIWWVSASGAVFGGAAAPAQQPPDDLVTTGFWNGVAVGSMSRTTDLVEVGYEMTARFSFTTDADGRIDHGRAVANYTPTFDASGVNELLEEARNLGHVVPLPFPIPTGMALRDVLAVRGVYGEGMFTVQGAITGQLTGDSLSIEWEGVEQIELPIKVFIDGVGGRSEEVTSESLTTEAPWPQSAAVSSQGGVVQAESRTEQHTEADGVVTVSTTTWSARPLPAGVPGGSAVDPVAPVQPTARRGVRFALPSRSVAEALLDRLTVKAEGNTDDFDREKSFDHWTDDEGGCTTREVVLQHDGPTIFDQNERCKVIAGSWYSPYDNAVWGLPGQVAIDHVVPLAEAWKSGASEWTEQQRRVFANDIDDSPELLTITSTVNSSKGDKDPARWRPPYGAFDCDYAKMWISVKAHYALTLQEAEKTALEEMLETCTR